MGLQFAITSGVALNIFIAWGKILRTTRQRQVHYLERLVVLQRQIADEQTSVEDLRNAIREVAEVEQILGKLIDQIKMAKEGLESSYSMMEQQ